MKKKYIWFSILGIMLIAAAYIYLEFNRTRGSVLGQKASFVVNATSLLEEFAKDEESANKKYGGLNLVMEVNGLVKGVENSPGGGVTILLGDTASGAMSSVRCLVDSLHTREAILLRPGDHCSCKGYFSGYKADLSGLLGSDIELNGCVPVKPD